jgi:hypothetical protein
MTEQEYLDSKNIVTEYVEDFTDRNGWKNISLTTLLKDYKKQLTLTDVSNWVAISSTEQPEIMTDVMVKYKDGRKEVAFFDGDKRFYIEKDDRDVTETIVEWHKLP